MNLDSVTLTSKTNKSLIKIQSKQSQCKQNSIGELTVSADDLKRRKYAKG